MPKPLVWLVAALAIPYLFVLSASGLLGPDEPRYAAIGHQMASSGDWITPMLWGKPWFEKPPLLYWLVAAFDSIGFSRDLAARLPVALMGLAFLLVLPGIEVALVLGTSIGWLALSQVGVTDIPMSVCFNIWLLMMLRGRPWVAGIALGLAVLAKGLVPLVLCLPVAWMYRREWRHWVGTLVTALPWYLACYAANGQVFIDEFIVKHHIQRFLSPELQHVQPFWFYVPVLIGLLMPWAPALLRVRIEEETKPYLYTAIWGFVFLSVSRNKLPAYVLPLLPSLAMLIAGKLMRWHYALAAGILVALPMAAPWLPTAIEEGLGKSVLSDSAWVWLLVVPVAGWIAWRYQKVGLVVAFLVSICALKWQLYPRLEQGRSRAQCLPAGASRGMRYTMSYYANREVDYCLETKEDIAPLEGSDQGPGDGKVKPGNQEDPKQR